MTFDLEGLREAFRQGRGFATGHMIDMMAACTPKQLERDGYIESARAGCWADKWIARDLYQPTTKLNEA